MGDTTTAAPATTPAATPDVKPGWQTTEFWTHMLVQVLLGSTIPALLHAFFVALPTSGLPAAIIAVGLAVIPSAMVWLQREYGDNRTELKALQAGADAAADPVAAANS